MHTVDDILFAPVTDPSQATQPAQQLSMLLGGEFDSYNVGGVKPSGMQAGGQQGGGGR